MTVFDWLAARALDAGIAVDEMPPGWMVFAGLCLFGAAVATLTWLIVGAGVRRREEAGRPEAESLTEAQPWLADRTEEIPAPVRRPRRHRYPIAYHPDQPDEIAETVQIPTVYGGRRG